MLCGEISLEVFLHKSFRYQILGKFLKNSLKNDRKKGKKYFVTSKGLRHPHCPEEAFTEWRKYWVSAAGRDESMQMTEMRKGKHKSSRMDNSSQPSDDGNYNSTAWPQVSRHHILCCLNIIFDSQIFFIGLQLNAWLPMYRTCMEHHSESPMPPLPNCRPWTQIRRRPRAQNLNIAPWQQDSTM